MPLTDNALIFAEAVFDKLELNKGQLGLQAVWFGDQDRLPSTPCATIEAGPKQRQLQGAPRRMLVELTTYVMLYVSIIQDSQENERLAMSLAEETEAVLHADSTFGNLVNHSYVSANDPGYAKRGGTLLRASRLTFTGQSLVQLPYG